MSKYWYQYLIPTYGNWGGPGFSGGKFENDRSKVNWDVPSIDAMDELFKLHDLDYQNGVDWAVADIKLLLGLGKVNVKGLWPNAYLYACKFIFYIKARR
jgi:hypothetical protein